MKQHGPGLLNDVTNPLLNLAILVVRSDSAEGNGLPFVSDVFSEEGVGESAIVHVVVLDSDVM